jgi:hypothetical protein
MEQTMKLLAAVVLCFALSGCGLFSERVPNPPEVVIKIVEKPVFVKPEFVMPVKPVMESATINDGMTDGEVARIIEADFLRFRTYATQQRNILESIQK